jgi:hypothetical protein
MKLRYVKKIASLITEDPNIIESNYEGLEDADTFSSFDGNIAIHIQGPYDHDYDTLEDRGLGILERHGIRIVGFRRVDAGEENGIAWVSGYGNAELTAADPNEVERIVARLVNSTLEIEDNNISIEMMEA